MFWARGEVMFVELIFGLGHITIHYKGINAIYMLKIQFGICGLIF
ncbi:hypothetical protein [Plasmodium yoelii yoelii]|uniref:Uncharacterized protein n=1 Tax=Plasmodium yoelii yoelii TaxID=73239 RepID=Q7RHN7_PLAYO|nr:hypothetical protein [Plasmodium yoelii yoelii]